MFFTTPFQPCREPKYRLAAFIKGKKGAKSEKQKQRAMGQALGFNVDDQASCCCRQTQRLTSANLACKRNEDWSLKKKRTRKLRNTYTYIYIHLHSTSFGEQTFISGIGNQFSFGQTNATEIVLNYFATILTFEGNSSASLAIFRTLTLTPTLRLSNVARLTSIIIIGRRANGTNSTKKQHK